MVRYGNQVPTFSRVGEYAYSDGADAVQAFKDMGSTFYPCQEDEMELFLARTEDNEPAGQTICISKPRQNGKSYGARHYAIWMAAVEGKNVLFSAHHGGTVRKMFKEIVNMFERNEELSELLKPGGNGIYRAQGMEGVYLTNGGMIEFSTRTNSLGRGATYDVIIIDEAQELQTTQLEALQPTTIASDSGDAQMIYLGTPPNEKCIGDVFKEFHKRAHSGEPNSIWWLEWAAEELGEDNSDVDLWYRCNPALGYRIKERNMRNAADTTETLSFFREYLGWWSKQNVNAAIDYGKWEACATQQPPEHGSLCYSVKFSSDGSAGSLSVCLSQSDGKPHVEVVDVKSMSNGISWFANWLEPRAGKASRIIVDGMSNAQPLVEELLKRGVPKRKIVVPKAADMAAACSMLLNAINEGAVTHYDQPGLNQSASTATKRSIGSYGGWGFAGDGAEQLESVALAFWGAANSRKNTNRKAKVAF